MSLWHMLTDSVSNVKHAADGAVHEMGVVAGSINDFIPRHLTVGAHVNGFGGEVSAGARRGGSHMSVSSGDVVKDKRCLPPASRRDVKHAREWRRSRIQRGGRRFRPTQDQDKREVCLPTLFSQEAQKGYVEGNHRAYMRHLPAEFGECKHCGGAWLNGRSHECRQKDGGRRYFDANAYDLHAVLPPTSSITDSVGYDGNLKTMIVTSARDRPPSTGERVYIDMSAGDDGDDNTSRVKCVSRVVDTDTNTLTTECAKLSINDEQYREIDDFDDFREDNEMIMSDDEKRRAREVARSVVVPSDEFGNNDRRRRSRRRRRLFSGDAFEQDNDLMMTDEERRIAGEIARASVVSVGRDPMVDDAIETVPPVDNGSTGVIPYGDDRHSLYGGKRFGSDPCDSEVYDKADAIIENICEIGETNPPDPQNNDWSIRDFSQAVNAKSLFSQLIDAAIEHKLGALPTDATTLRSRRVDLARKLKTFFADALEYQFEVVKRSPPNRERVKELKERLERTERELGRIVEGHDRASQTMNMTLQSIQNDIKLIMRGDWCTHRVQRIGGQASVVREDTTRQIAKESIVNNVDDVVESVSIAFPR